MVGGRVVEVAEVPGRQLMWINAAARPYKRIEYCSVLVRKDSDSEQIQIGDKVWWQGGCVYWTMQDESRVEVPLKKVGGSGVTYASACGKAGA